MSTQFVPHERDEIGRICRQAYQTVGVSDPFKGWNDISEERRERHRQAGVQIIEHLKAWEERRRAQLVEATHVP